MKALIILLLSGIQVHIKFWYYIGLSANKVWTLSNCHDIDVYDDNFIYQTSDDK